MKHNVKAIAAFLMAMHLLVGCGANAAPTVTAAPAGTTAATEAATVTEPTQTLPPETEPPMEAAEPFQVDILPVITEDQQTVTVKTPDEFLAAIAPNTEIVVDAPLIDWSKASGYGKGTGEYYHWYEAFDGPELYITGVSNLTIRGSGDDCTANVLSAVPRYANVLTFENCRNIMVQGLTAGHTEEPGYCLGGVLCFQNCQDILVENCGLFGCGTLGVMGISSKDMQIVNNEIYECSVGGVEFTNCDDVNVDGNTFRDLGGPEFRVYGCGIITCNGETVHDFSPRQ